ncbi:MAG: phage portal protein [Firmicutes bacterium]|nr:phage portal protein [Bacillota bacterium]
MATTTRKRDLTAFPRLAYQDPNTALQYQYLGQEGLELVNKLIEWYRHYDGKHWVDKRGVELKPEDLKAQNNLDYLPTMVTANLTAWFIDRLAAFMFEHPIGLACPAEQIDDPAEMLKPGYEPSEKQKAEDRKAAAREKLLYQVIKQNLMSEKLLKAATDHFIGGGVCAKLHYDANMGLRIIWRPRLEYWPVYSADDVDVLEKIHFTAFVDDKTIWKQTYWMQEGSCWMEEGLYDTQLKLKEQTVAPNDLGIPFMPEEIFNRGGLTGETEGRSMVDVLSGLNDEVERKISDNADSLRFGMFAIKVIVNAVLPTEDEIREGAAEPLQVAPNALWELNSDGETDADAKMLEHKFEYKEALKEHLEQIMSLMHRLSDVPNISPEQVKGLGQLSGFAIKLLYGSIISATNRHMITWKPRLQRLLGKALYLLNKYDTRQHYDSKLISAAALNEITLGDIDDLVEVKTTMPIPENETEVVDRETKKVATMLQSLKGAMDELGVENPEAKMAEILAEKTTIMEALGDTMDEPESGGDEGNSGDNK